MRKQTVRYTATGSIGVILVLVLALMANWIAARHWKRADWTSSQMYSLSERTGNLLNGLTDDVKVIVFMVPGSPLYEQTRELLSRYEALSDKISVEYIDPDREPLKTKQLAEQFGISVADTVVFSVGDRTKYVSSDQMADYDYSGMQYGQPASMRAFKGEEQFTSAILSLVAPSVPKIYFTTGHGEPALTASGSMSERGLAVLKEELKRANMEVDEASLMAGVIPDDADVIAIVGPTEPFTEAEIQLLDQYVDGGGRLLVCLDPLIAADGHMRSTRLEPFLAGRGVLVRDDLVVDPSRRLPFYDLSAVYLSDFSDHPVAHGLEGVAALFLVARSVGAAEGYEADVKPVVETSSEGWGETDLGKLLRGEPIADDDGDTRGPVAVAVTVEHASTGDDDDAADPDVDTEFGSDDEIAPGVRMVVFGDSDFMSDTEIVNAGNETLALNAFDWLATRDQSLGIAPREVEHVSLFLTRQQLGRILLLTLLVMPGAAIVAGILVWRRRRH